MNYRKNGNRLELLDGHQWRLLYEFPDPIEDFKLQAKHGIVVTTEPSTDKRNIWLIGFDGGLKWQIVPTNDPAVLPDDGDTGWIGCSIDGDRLIAYPARINDYLIDWMDGTATFYQLSK